MLNGVDGIGSLIDRDPNYLYLAWKKYLIALERILYVKTKFLLYVQLSRMML